MNESIKILDHVMPNPGYNMLSGDNRIIGKILLIGRQVNSSYYDWSNVLVYNESGPWDNVIPLNAPNSRIIFGGHSVQFGNIIYFFAGDGKNVYLYKFHTDTAVYTNIVEGNNIFTDSSMPICADEMVYGIKIFVGYNGYFSLISNTWHSTSGDTYFNKHYGASCAIRDSYLFVVRRNIVDKVLVDGIGTASMVVESFPILPDAYQIGGSIANYLNYIIIFGGLHFQRFNTYYKSTITVFDTDTNNVWSNDDALPSALSDMSVFIRTENTDEFLAFGGQNDGNIVDTITQGYLFEL